MADYVALVRERVAALPFDGHFFAYGHLGDGNLHFSVALRGDIEQHRHGIEEAVYEPLRALGGSVSAEHGIGLEKQPWLNISRSETELALMRRLKHALDPKGLLNRGKIFDYDGAEVPR